MEYAIAALEFQNTGMDMMNEYKKENSPPDNLECKDSRLFWESFGSWQDERSAKEIVRDIYETRRSRTRDVQL